MSLATRCTACGTVFRVVQDQLKVSEGWVRCGRCSEVFNALQGLFDLERDAPPEPAPAIGVPEASSAGAPASATAHADVDLDIDVESAGASEHRPAHLDHVPPVHSPDHRHAHDEHLLSDRIDAQLTTPRDTDTGSTPATRVSERDRLEFPDAQFDPDMLFEAGDAVDAPLSGLPDSSETDLELPLIEPAEPHFVLDAQRQARWQSPKMRALQGAALVSLLLLLGLQGAHHFRDQIAARWPSTAPVLAAWCGAASCAIEAPRRIDDLVVESTALTRAAVPDAFKLSVVLRNRGAMPVMLPSVDLSLTDASGQQLARRMLSPRDFQVADGLVKPGAESPLQLVLRTTGATQVTGYTVEVFYP
jgi:predicted Zn finger-like uncharacterized protein